MLLNLKQFIFQKQKILPQQIQQLENQKFDADLQFLLKSEEQILNKTKTSRKLKQKPEQLQETMIQDGQATKTPVPETDLEVQVDPQTFNGNTTQNSTGLISSIFYSVTNYLFENGTGAFFQLKQYNQNSLPKIEENAENN